MAASEEQMFGFGSSPFPPPFDTEPPPIDTAPPDLSPTEGNSGDVGDFTPYFTSASNDLEDWSNFSTHDEGADVGMEGSSWAAFTAPPPDVILNEGSIGDSPAPPPDVISSKSTFNTEEVVVPPPDVISNETSKHPDIDEAACGDTSEKFAAFFTEGPALVDEVVKCDDESVEEVDCDKGNKNQAHDLTTETSTEVIVEASAEDVDAAEICSDESAAVVTGKIIDLSVSSEGTEADSSLDTTNDPEHAEIKEENTVVDTLDVEAAPLNEGNTESISSNDSWKDNDDTWVKPTSLSHEPQHDQFADFGDSDIEAAPKIFSDNTSKEEPGDFGNSESNLYETVKTNEPDQSGFGNFGTFDSEKDNNPTDDVDSFGDFGAFDSETVSAETSNLAPTAANASTTAATTTTTLTDLPVGEDDFGDFGASEPPITDPSESNDFAAFDANDETIAPPSICVTEESAPSDFGDFGAFDSNTEDSHVAATPTGIDNVEGSTTTTTTTTAQDDFGDFGNFDSNKGCQSADVSHDFGSFGAFDSASTSSDVTEALKITKKNDFGDFGGRENSTDFGDFGEFDETPQVSAEPVHKDFGDFGDFDSTSKNDNSNDFGDFGAFDNPPSTVLETKHPTDQQTCTETVNCCFPSNDSEETTTTSYGLTAHLNSGVVSQDADSTLWVELTTTKEIDSKYFVHYYASNCFQKQLTTFQFEYWPMKVKHHRHKKQHSVASSASFDMEPATILVPQPALTVPSKNTLLAQSLTKNESPVSDAFLSPVKKEGGSETTSETNSLDLEFFVSAGSASFSAPEQEPVASDLVGIDFWNDSQKQGDAFTTDNASVSDTISIGSSQPSADVLSVCSSEDSAMRNSDISSLHNDNGNGNEDIQEAVGSTETNSSKSASVSTEGSLDKADEFAGFASTGNSDIVSLSSDVGFGGTSEDFAAFSTNPDTTLTSNEDLQDDFAAFSTNADTTLTDTQGDHFADFTSAATPPVDSFADFTSGDKTTGDDFASFSSSEMPTPIAAFPPMNPILLPTQTGDGENQQSTTIEPPADDFANFTSNPIDPPNEDDFTVFSVNNMDLCSTDAASNEGSSVSSTDHIPPTPNLYGGDFANFTQPTEPPPLNDDFSIFSSDIPVSSGSGLNDSFSIFNSPPADSQVDQFAMFTSPDDVAANLNSEEFADFSSTPTSTMDQPPAFDSLSEGAVTAQDEFADFSTPGVADDFAAFPAPSTPITNNSKSFTRFSSIPPTPSLDSDDFVPFSSVIPPPMEKKDTLSSIPEPTSTPTDDFAAFAPPPPPSLNNFQNESLSLFIGQASEKPDELSRSASEVLTPTNERVNEFASFPTTTVPSSNISVDQFAMFTSSVDVPNAEKIDEFAMFTSPDDITTPTSSKIDEFAMFTGGSLDQPTALNSETNFTDFTSNTNSLSSEAPTGDNQFEVFAKPKRITDNLTDTTSTSTTIENSFAIFEGAPSAPSSVSDNSGLSSFTSTASSLDSALHHSSVTPSDFTSFAMTTPTATTTNQEFADFADFTSAEQKETSDGFAAFSSFDTAPPSSSYNVLNGLDTLSSGTSMPVQIQADSMLALGGINGNSVLKEPANELTAGPSFEAFNLRSTMQPLPPPPGSSAHSSLSSTGTLEKETNDPLSLFGNTETATSTNGDKSDTHQKKTSATPLDDFLANSQKSWSNESQISDSPKHTSDIPPGQNFRLYSQLSGTSVDVSSCSSISSFQFGKDNNEQELSDYGDFPDPGMAIKEEEFADFESFGSSATSVASECEAVTTTIMHIPPPPESQPTDTNVARFPPEDYQTQTHLTVDVNTCKCPSLPGMFSPPHLCSFASFEESPIGSSAPGSNSGFFADFSQISPPGIDTGDDQPQIPTAATASLSPFASSMEGSVKPQTEPGIFLGDVDELSKSLADCTVSASTTPEGSTSFGDFEEAFSAENSSNSGLQQQQMPQILPQPPKPSQQQQQVLPTLQPQQQSQVMQPQIQPPLQSQVQSELFQTPQQPLDFNAFQSPENINSTSEGKVADNSNSSDQFGDLSTLNLSQSLNSSSQLSWNLATPFNQTPNLSFPPTTAPSQQPPQQQQQPQYSFAQQQQLQSQFQLSQTQFQHQSQQQQFQLGVQQQLLQSQQQPQQPQHPQHPQPQPPQPQPPQHTSVQTQQQLNFDMSSLQFPQQQQQQQQQQQPQRLPVHQSFGGPAAPNQQAFASMTLNNSSFTSQSAGGVFPGVAQQHQNIPQFQNQVPYQQHVPQQQTLVRGGGQVQQQFAGAPHPSQQFVGSAMGPRQFMNMNLRQPQHPNQLQPQLQQQQQQQQHHLSQKQRFLQQNRMPKFKPPAGKDPFSSFTIRNNAEQLSISLENRTITSGSVKPKLNQIPTKFTGSGTAVRPPT